MPRAIDLVSSTGMLLSSWEYFIVLFPAGGNCGVEIAAGQFVESRVNCSTNCQDVVVSFVSTEGVMQMEVYKGDDPDW